MPKTRAAESRHHDHRSRISMTTASTFVPTLLAAFMASTVECVEALTIVLAVGVVRGWRSALIGAGGGLLLLVAAVLAFGSALSAVPLAVLQGVVGTLLLLFGLRWLRKAILRAAGVLALHDEASAFAKQSAALREGAPPWWGGIDVVAFVTSFKAVLIEGLEVVFIVIAIGASGTLLWPAALGALLALLLVVTLGLAIRQPLSRVPENALKFAVGAMLSAFGCFWVGEALGTPWPGADLAILVLIGSFVGAALLLVGMSRRLHANASRRPGVARPPSLSASPGRTGVVASTARELWGLFVDDGWLAAGILLVLAAGAAIVHFHAASGVGANVALAAALLAVLGASAARRAAT